jgi:proline iminopeptidase
MGGRRGLYPELPARRTGYLGVDARHTLYFEDCGNPDGKPALFVHGGPGGGIDARQRRFWDPATYRIILFEQRGCGRSTPHASLEDNTTWHLVDDMERLREHLRIDRWQLFGGSWGSALSLAYAQAHPDRVTELVLRGIFLLRRREIDWYYQGGAAHLFPDAWEGFVAPIPAEERGDLVAAYHRRLTSADPEARMRAARAWSIWEATTSTLVEDPALVRRAGEARFAEAFARIECHYFFHRGFLEHDDQLLRGVPALRGIPAVLVQGRYDVVCPMESAWALHRAWPEAELRVVPDAGHAASEPGVVAELVAATDRFRP